MKVIKNGSAAPDGLENWNTEVTCAKRDKFDSKGCGAVLEVTEEDLILMYWHGTHSAHHYSGMKCPQCGKYNAVENLPDPIWNRLNTKKRRAKSVFDGFSESL
jgi:hypothetical protein